MHACCVAVIAYVGDDVVVVAVVPGEALEVLGVVFDVERQLLEDERQDVDAGRQHDDHQQQHEHVQPQRHDCNDW